MNTNTLNSSPWYAKIQAEDPLQQGDILKDCNVLVPTSSENLEEDNLTGYLLEYDVIVMSQSCDLASKKIELVLVCPLYTLDYLAEQDKKFKQKQEKERLRKGLYNGFHLLNSCNESGFKNQFLVVDFRNVHSIPFNYLKSFVKKCSRTRLLPPYREHLSQAFARFFMRVGLPLDIPSF